jgi:hypothetical protein
LDGESSFYSFTFDKKGMEQIVSLRVTPKSANAEVTAKVATLTIKTLIKNKL